MTEMLLAGTAVTQSSRRVPSAGYFKQVGGRVWLKLGISAFELLLISRPSFHACRLHRFFLLWKKMPKLYHILHQIPLNQVEESTTYLWHFSSVQGLSEDIPCDDPRVQRKDPLPRLCTENNWGSRLRDSLNSWSHHRPSHPNSGRHGS